MDRRRLKRAVLPIGLLLLLAGYVHACVPRPITDLAVVRVDRVSAADLPRGDPLRAYLHAPGEGLRRITLAGSGDWPGEVRRHGLNSYPIVLRCDRPDEALFAHGPLVAGARLDPYTETQPPAIGASQQVRYELWLPEVGRYRSQADANRPMPAYDLRRERVPLCIRIAGGSMSLAYNSSNLVRVEVGGTR